MRKIHPHQPIVGLGGLSIEDFWIWAYSDVLINVTRNAFAEFVVGFALGRLHEPRTGLEPTIFNYRDRRVEVRAASYVQSEPQRKKSKINFNITPRKSPQNPDGQRPHCYVFSLFIFDDYADKDAARSALLNIEQWCFYPIAQETIEQHARDKKTLGVSWMDSHCEGGPVTYVQLKQRIDRILGLTP